MKVTVTIEWPWCRDTSYCSGTAKDVREILANLKRDYKAGVIKGAYVLVEGGRNGDKEYCIDADGVTLM